MTDKKSNIKIIRLKTGVDIMANVTDNDEKIDLLDPMVLIFKRTSMGSVMMLYPWLPSEVLEENSATLYTDDILTMVIPKQKMIDYYVTMVDIFLTKWMGNDKIMENLDMAISELESGEFSAEEYMEELEFGSEQEEYTDEQEEVETLKRNNLLH